MSLLETRGLTLSRGGKPICRDLDFQMEPGECWGLLGTNGIGKTTLLHTLAGLRTPERGDVRIDDAAIGTYTKKNLARKVGVLFQDSQDAFPLTVMETAMTGRYPHIPFWALESAEDIRAARQALLDVELDTLADRQVNTLSGGERRRLALATLFCQAPSIYLLDEPANHLDLHHQITLLDLVIRRVRAAGGAILMVLHDVNLLTRFCSHAMLIMDNDNIVRGPRDTVMNAGNLERVYRHRINAIRAGTGIFYFPE